MVFDKSSKESFANVDSWMKEVNSHADQDSIKLLVGNKADLDCAVDSNEGKAKAESFGVQYVETSAKSAYQVTDAFMNIAQELLKQKKGKPVVQPRVSLSKEPENKNSCC